MDAYSNLEVRRRNTSPGMKSCRTCLLGAKYMQYARVPSVGLASGGIVTLAEEHLAA